jgi:uncharacterized protein (DUF433 family)
VFDRVVSNSSILAGKPRIKGTRISVEFILELVASEASREDIVKARPHASPSDTARAPDCAGDVSDDIIAPTVEVSG